MPAFPAAEWPIAACLHGVPTVLADGRTLHDAGPEAWEAAFAQVAAVDFSMAELADSHIRPADLSSAHRAELVAVAAARGIAIPSVHVQRQSVIEPGRGEQNLAYAHRTIDAAAEMGMSVFSTGLHRPLSDAQRRALWFWSVEGPRDPADDPATWALAVTRLRELGRHAGEVGLRVSLEMYEDTYLGTADSAVRLVEEIGLDNVGLNPDIGNLVRLHRPIEDWREAYAKTLPYANYWHVKNYTRDETFDRSRATSAPSTMASGLIDYRHVIQQAVAVGFDGVILCEHYGGDSLGMCAANQRYIRDVLAAGERAAAPASAVLPVP
ncbi:xylose isomerase [Microbacterium sp. Y-01]|uniref:sugar phosphate isomerase/epimerase family protein n=1 Tax=Microbacterium sp. Y-01 TaxID=2048898 RepID=UPI000F5DA6AF|nr:sugar phosphate isomerase/epimerase family protein [Microbacterium sp. Y-01]AZH77988.1 xylose isomerase [Microbacterium sp. Y-01]